MKHIILCSLALLIAASLPFMAKAQYIEVNGITYNVLSPTSHTVEDRSTITIEKKGGVHYLGCPL